MLLCWQGGCATTVQRLWSKAAHRSGTFPRWPLSAVPSLDILSVDCAGSSITEWNPLKGQRRPPDASRLKQATSRSLIKSCWSSSSHPRSPHEHWLSWSCSLQVQVLQRHHFRRKVWGREVETTITLAAPLTHFNEGAQTRPAIDKRSPALH